MPLAIGCSWYICPRCDGGEDGGVTASAHTERARNEDAEDHEEEGECGDEGIQIEGRGTAIIREQVTDPLTRVRRGGCG